MSLAQNDPNSFRHLDCNLLEEYAHGWVGEISRTCFRKRVQIPLTLANGKVTICIYPCVPARVKKITLCRYSSKYMRYRDREILTQYCVVFDFQNEFLNSYNNDGVEREETPYDFLGCFQTVDDPHRYLMDAYFPKLSS